MPGYCAGFREADEAGAGRTFEKFSAESCSSGGNGHLQQIVLDDDDEIEQNDITFCCSARSPFLSVSSSTHWSSSVLPPEWVGLTFA